MREDAIARLLPGIYQDAAVAGSPLDALLGVMSSLHNPVEARLDGLDALFDPRRAPDPFVAMLAQWLGLGVLLEDVPAERGQRPAGIDPADLRELVVRAADLSRARGTLPSLQRFLELATGLKGIEIAQAVDADGTPRPFAVTLSLPPEAGRLRSLIERIVDLEKPASTTVEIIERKAAAQETK
jgi:phage tail-like protein